MWFRLTFMWVPYRNVEFGRKPNLKMFVEETYRDFTRYDADLTVLRWGTNIDPTKMVKVQTRPRCPKLVPSELLLRQIQRGSVRDDATHHC